MFLHPREAVLEALDVNHRGFAVVHHYLDVAVQQTAVSWEDCYDDLTEVHGATLATTVRERVRAVGRRGALHSTTLRMITVANCGQHLYDASGRRYRILERPLSKASPGRLLPATEPEVDILFGTIDKLDFELAVLWSVAHKAKSLQKVVLAAIADFDSQNPVIYAEELLPAPPRSHPGVRPARTRRRVRRRDERHRRAHRLRRPVRRGGRGGRGIVVGRT